MYASHNSSEVEAYLNEFVAGMTSSPLFNLNARGSFTNEGLYHVLMLFESHRSLAYSFEYVLPLIKTSGHPSGFWTIQMICKQQNSYSRYTNFAPLMLHYQLAPNFNLVMVDGNRSTLAQRTCLEGKSSWISAEHIYVPAILTMLKLEGLSDRKEIREDVEKLKLDCYSRPTYMQAELPLLKPHVSRKVTLAYSH